MDQTRTCRHGPSVGNLASRCLNLASQFSIEKGSIWGKKKVRPLLQKQIPLHPTEMLCNAFELFVDFGTCICRIVRVG
jgi:hypothetical protein